MPNMKALFLALLVLLVSGSAAFAQPLSDVATYTNWSLANSTNPFTGRKGITHEEASRLPVGTLITLPDGSTHALKRGEYIWKLNRAYAVKVPLATRALPDAPHAATPPSVKTPKVAEAAPPAKAKTPALPEKKIALPAQAPAIDPMKETQARIEARYQAERETARLAEEASALRVTAEDGLAIATGSMTAAFAAQSKGEAREQAESARSTADLVRKNADEAGRIAAEATIIANRTDSDKAKKTALSVRADADATSIAAANAEKVAQQAATAPGQWKWDFGPLWRALIVIGTIVAVVLAYTIITTLAFRLLPGLFNFVFKGGLQSDSVFAAPVKALAIPALLVADTFIKNKPFMKEYYDYLPELGDSPEDADTEDELIDAVEAEPSPANDGDEKERRFPVYPDDKRLEVHQVLH